MKAAFICAIAGLASVSSAGIVITEVYVGIPGNDGTEDWIEIVNTGTQAIDLGDFAYEDDSAISGSAEQINSLIVGAGELAIIMQGDASSVTEFNNLWGYSGLITFADGGGGLSQDGDQANIIDIANNVVVASVDTPATSGFFSSIDYSTGSAQLSQFVGWSFQSGDVVDDEEGTNQIWGSPGVVPAPSAMALLGLGGLVAGRRRR